MIVNFNIGLLGHVDSGKTTLARALSTISSTAAFDKNPQSQERGITLDLGFSALQVTPAPAHILVDCPSVEGLQLTFVDCPGHASLIRTIIGGAQIIDMMILVIDALKGVQTQTGECIIIGELLCRRLLVVVNIIDLLPESKRQTSLEKLNKQLRKTLANTAFGGEVPIFNISAQSGTNLQQLLDGICAHSFLPKRQPSLPLLMYVDHCFSIKGQGTVCTGTIIQGTLHVNDVVELPAIREQRQVKSMQMFRRAVQSAAGGDRVGVCITQFNAKKLERGLVTQPGYLQPIYAACIKLQRISYYKFAIKSKSKFHISVGHETVMAKVTLFQANNTAEEATSTNFSLEQEYAYLDEIEPRSDNIGNVYALLEFETAILATTEATLIASKLDMDVHTNSCRLAFWGNIQWLTHCSNYVSECLSHLKVFKSKLKEGTIQRVVNEHDVIVQNLFKKDANRDMYVGKKVTLSTGEVGCIESTFGQTSKVKIHFSQGIRPDTLAMLKCGRTSEVVVQLRFKKYVFNKNVILSQ